MCLNGFQMFTGTGYNACFAVFSGQPLTWTGARDECTAKGATLASLHNADEMQFAIGK